MSACKIDRNARENTNQDTVPTFDPPCDLSRDYGLALIHLLWQGHDRQLLLGHVVCYPSEYTDVTESVDTGHNPKEQAKRISGYMGNPFAFIIACFLKKHSIQLNWLCIL